MGVQSRVYQKIELSSLGKSDLNTLHTVECHKVKLKA
jgi:hypothetical protein